MESAKQIFIIFQLKNLIFNYKKEFSALKKSPKQHGQGMFLQNIPKISPCFQKESIN
jgi:hypothetical protein